MGSVEFGGEDESLPSTSNGMNYKLSKRLLDGCGAVNHASIPRKLRSAIKKRGRGSVISPLITSRKQHHVSTTVDTLRKDGAKKSKLNMKKGHITKDEEEVAETLYALADMFSDSSKIDQQKIDNEKPEIKSSATLEEGVSISTAQDTCPTLREETRKISSHITLGAVCPQNMVNSTTEDVIYQTLEARRHECFSSKQVSTHDASEDQSDFNPSSTSRPLISRLSINQSGNQGNQSDRVVASGFQYGPNCSSVGDKYNDLYQSPNMSATRATSFKTHKSCGSARSHLFEGTTFSSQPRIIETKISNKECTRVGTKSNKSWKRCSAHIYISRLIKFLQLSDRKEGSPVTPTQPICRGAELQSHGNAYLNAIDTVASKKEESSETQNVIRLHKGVVQDQQMASETSAMCSAKQEYDFLSLGPGICRLDTGKSVNGAGCFLDSPKQYHMSYMQSHNPSSMPFSLPQNVYSSSMQSHNSASAAHQVQISQYHRNLTSRPGQQQQMESQQQKWATHLQTHYNTVGNCAVRLPEWRNGGLDSASVLNYAHSLFPHLHAALGSKYQQLPPSQQQHMLMNTPLPVPNTKRRNNLPLRFERNGAVFNPENMAQLQLPCNQHL